MSQTNCRMGILGAAEIARKYWKAIKNAGNATLTGVASRSKEKAGRFIEECQSHVPFDPPPRGYDSYEALLNSKEVDAVYIPLPTGIRKEWVIRAAEAGKHVLAEKPAGTNQEEVQAILEACRKNKVQYMDGTMFLHSRRLDRIREVLDDGQSIGQLKRVTAQFSFAAPDEFLQNNIRVHSGLEPLGVLGDLGWYCIRFILWTMKETLPDKIRARILSEFGRSDSAGSVPTEFSAELIYPDGVSAQFYCSFLTELQQWVHLSGTKGYLAVPDFVLPYYGSELAFEVNQAVYHIAGCDFNMQNHTRRHAVTEYSNSMENAQETHMIKHFAQLAMSGSPDFSWGESTLKTQMLLDACLKAARETG